MVFYTFVFLLFLSQSYGIEVISAEDTNAKQPKKEKHVANLDKSNRRFIQDLNDEEWHISHLKDTDFARRSECAGDTFKDKVNKYRRALKNDAALVQFVSADPLPFNESDLLVPDTCPAPRSILDVMTTKSVDAIESTNSDTSTNSTEPNSTQAGESTISQDNVVTTTPGKSTLPGVNKVGNKTGKGRRAGDYAFSSVEYYEDVTDFDDSLCPNAVEVITLQIDQLRSYDVECEMMLEWRSLD